MTDRTNHEHYELPRSRLVQRLKTPFGGFAGMVDNPFSFGGGMKNGGLSDEAMGLLRGIFSFDYMGAAEFEWGAVPEALQVIAKSAERYQAFEFTIPLSKVAANWRDRSNQAPEGEATVYVICHEKHAKEVTKRLKTWAAKDHVGDLKEHIRFASALRPVEEWDRETCGWLELDNGFFFFTDRGMWEATAALFGVTTPAHTYQQGPA